MTYFDRSISRPHLEEDVTVYAISCLMLAWKMSNHSFNVNEFLRKRKKLFNIRKRVAALELRIIDALIWKLHVVTPFCFLSFFLQHFPFVAAYITTINQIIIQ